MDSQRFDAVVKSLARAARRRDFVRFAVGAALAGAAGAATGPDADAKRRKKRCRDNASVNANTCPDGANYCVGTDAGGCGASGQCRCYLDLDNNSVCGAAFTCPGRPCRNDNDCSLSGVLHGVCVKGGDACCPGGGNVCVAPCPSPACRGEGRVCKDDGDCCSRICRGQNACKRCQPCPASGCPGSCRAADASCTHDGDCCSGECGCDFGDCRCRASTCHALNEPCSDDLECCDGRCVPNGPTAAFCAGDDCRPVGYPCSSGGQCCSDRCDADPFARQRRCCVTKGMACDVSECCYPLACEWPGQPPGVCCTPIGLACGDGSVCCKAGTCGNGTCCLPFRAQCETRGHQDLRSPDCCAGGCDENTCCVPPQGACNSASECCGGRLAQCVDGKCCLPSGYGCGYARPGDCCNGNGICGPDGRCP